MTIRIQAALWDIDGTLVDSEPAHERSIDEVLRAIGGSLDLAAREQIFGTSLLETHAVLAKLHPALPDLPAFMAAKTASYLELAGELLFRPGAKEALAWLDSVGVPSGFVSNAHRVVVEANLRAVGVEGRITVARDDVRQGKPHPEPYLLAAERLGLDPSACVVIEDSPLGSIAGLAAGMTVVAWPASRDAGLSYPQGAIIADPLDLIATLQDVVQIGLRKEVV